jgi:protoporphyrinogen oxidase
MIKPHIAVLGAGPAGLGAAFQLARRGVAQVTVFERHGVVGGNAGSFELAGVRVDYGSHRLHPSCDPEVMRDIRVLLGDDLMDRPRHGRIRLRQRWIHFPLKPVDLIMKLPTSFMAGAAADIVGKLLRENAGADDTETFATALQAGLGRTICRDFYFPYAKKLWGLGPEELSVTQARRRVKANSLMKMVRKVLSVVPGLKGPGSGRFFYPRHGFGQISEAYSRAAQAAGADILFNAKVLSIEARAGGHHTVYYEKYGRVVSVPVTQVWSTIPITTLCRCLVPSPPAEVLQAAASINYRAMILIYLVLEQERFSEYDAHYFPESTIPISRLSEPKNYSNSRGPRTATVLCAELPCSRDGSEWNKSDEELGRLMLKSLEDAGIPVQVPVKEVVTRRLPQAYPIYRRGYEVWFDRLDGWLSRIDGLLTFGRQGLFAHDNTHHALYMAYCAVACLDENGLFDCTRWRDYRRIFETHVVED